MKARVYVAGAVEDQSFPDDMKTRLEEALTKAGVRHGIDRTRQARLGVPRHAGVRCRSLGAALADAAGAVRQYAEGDRPLGESKSGRLGNRVLTQPVFGMHAVFSSRWLPTPQPDSSESRRDSR